MGAQGIVKLDVSSTTPQARLGQIYIDDLGRQFIYGRANGAVTVGQWHVQTEETFDMTPMTTALVGTPGTNWKNLGVATVTAADNAYLWFWIGYGAYECIIENGHAAGDVLYTTINAGIPGPNSSSATIDGVKTLDAGVTSTRVTVVAAGRLTAGMTQAHD